MPLSRRTFIDRTVKAGGLGVTATLSSGGFDRILAASRDMDGVSPQEAASDELYWGQIQQSFNVDRSIINLNNGGVCPTPRVVHDAFKRYLDVQNMTPSLWMWSYLRPGKEMVRKRLALTAGCDPEEMAITRNASEALEIAQFGIDFEPGDEVLTTDQDYPRMITTWRQREMRDGIKLVQFPVPTPPRNKLELAGEFEKHITPRTKAILLCHVMNITGQIYPVKEVCEIAHRRGIPVIVDGAHAFAHVVFNMDDLGCDYYGTSLHKWLTAPIGTGFLYVAKHRIKDHWPLMAAGNPKADNIRKFEEIGTHPAANINAINEALIFFHALGPERKAARLHYLKMRWAERLLRHDRVYLRCNLDPSESVGVATVGIEGIAPGPLASHLWSKHRIHCIAIARDPIQALRITPNVYTTPREIDMFVAAMEEVIENGLPS